MAIRARPLSTKRDRNRTMNLPTEIAPLEAELNRVLRMYDEDEKRLAQSTTPEVDRIFFGSTKKMRHEIERRLQRARAERRHEVASLRLRGNQLADGGMEQRGPDGR